MNISSDLTEQTRSIPPNRDRRIRYTRSIAGVVQNAVLRYVDGGTCLVTRYSATDLSVISADPFSTMEHAEDWLLGLGYTRADSAR